MESTVVMSNTHNTQKILEQVSGRGGGEGVGWGEGGGGVESIVVMRNKHNTEKVLEPVSSYEFECEFVVETFSVLMTVIMLDQ
jgi:hypothetical protein